LGIKEDIENLIGRGSVPRQFRHIRRDNKYTHISGSKKEYGEGDFGAPVPFRVGANIAGNLSQQPLKGGVQASSTGDAALFSGLGPDLSRDDRAQGNRSRRVLGGPPNEALGIITGSSTLILHLVADDLYDTYSSGSQITGTWEDRSDQNNHVSVQPTVSGTRPSFDDLFYKPHDDVDDLVEKGSIHFNMNPTQADRRKFFVIDDISDSHQLGSMANKMLYLVLRADEGTDEFDTEGGHPAGASYNHRMPGNIGALNATGTFSPFEDLFVVGMRNYTNEPMAFRAAGKTGILNFITGSVPLGLGQTVISGAEGGHEDFYIDTYTAGRDIKSIDLLELMMFSGSVSHSDGQMDKVLESLRRKYFPALRAKISSSATDGTS
jgi:hypothetical protein